MFVVNKNLSIFTSSESNGAYEIKENKMNCRQTALDYAKDQLKQGKITADQANVLMVQIEGVRLIEGKVPADVRRALNAAVKAGELGHLKKDGLKPEAYFHKNGRARAIEERNSAFRSSMDALKGIFA